jgi:hypothetical protein
MVDTIVAVVFALFLGRWMYNVEKQITELQSAVRDLVVLMRTRR